MLFKPFVCALNVKNEYLIKKKIEREKTTFIIRINDKNEKIIHQMKSRIDYIATTLPNQKSFNGMEPILIARGVQAWHPLVLTFST